MYLLLYTFVYYNIDSILNKFYLSNLSNLPNNVSYNYNELIINNNEFYYSITNINLCALLIYSIYIFKNLIYYTSINKYSLSLSLMYIKYTLTCLLTNNMSI